MTATKHETSTPQPRCWRWIHIGARISALAGPGEVLVSQTVKDLAADSGLAFEDAGEHELKGTPDRWGLYRVVAETHSDAAPASACRPQKGCKEIGCVLEGSTRLQRCDSLPRLSAAGR